jgi:tetratricopeptide (TPR) repeat protein
MEFVLKNIVIYALIVLIIFSLKNSDAQIIYNAEAEQLLDVGRNLFYASVEDKSKLDSAFLIFEKYQNLYPEFQGRATTYIGVLTALRGRHAFWIYTKYNLVKEGLKIMDQGIEQSPDDIEALFVYGSTCFFMPFLFGRKDEAQNAFVKIIELLPQNIQHYDHPLMGNVIDFLIEHTDLTEHQITQLKQMKADLNLK